MRPANCGAGGFIKLHARVILSAIAVCAFGTNALLGEEVPHKIQPQQSQQLHKAQSLLKTSNAVQQQDDAAPLSVRSNANQGSHVGTKYDISMLSQYGTGGPSSGTSRNAAGTGCGCPGGALDEGEGCGNDTNGGCNSTPPAFIEVDCNQTWCGTAWADGGSRDTDWYRIQHPGGILSVTITSDFPSVTFVIEDPGNDCDLSDVIFHGDNGCSDGCMVTQVGGGVNLPAGEYLIFVGAGNCDGTGIFEGFACGTQNDYILEITCEALCESDADCTDPGAPNCCPDGVCAECCEDADCPGPDDKCSNGVCFTPISCDPGDIPEDEPDCGTVPTASCTTDDDCPGLCDLDLGFCEPVDTVDGGCNSDPPVFLPINCGQSYCGTVAADDNFRDTDWYQLEALAVDTELTLTISASFNGVAGIVDTGGSGDCADATAIDPLVTFLAGETQQLVATVGPGTWWLFVGPDFTEVFPCDGNRNYELTVECAVPSGACCDGGECVGDLPEDVCLGGGAGMAPICQWDVNADCIVNAADLAQLLGNWGACGDPCAPGVCNPNCAWDFNYDCIVNAADLAQLLGNWGSCGMDYVPGHPICPTAVGAYWTDNATCDPPGIVPSCNTGCGWTNGVPLDDFGAPASQYDPVFPFSGEAADDFILLDEGNNPCLITGLTFWATYFGVPAGVVPDPLTQWTGVHVTIYEDISDPKSPAGHRNDDGSFTGGVVASYDVTLGQMFISPFPTVVITDVFQVEMILPATILEKNTKYWLVIQPIMDFAQFGQTAILLSIENHNHPAQQIFDAAGLPDWVVIDGDGTDGTHNNLAFILSGDKVDPGATGACCNQLTGNCQDDILVTDCIQDPDAIPFIDEICDNVGCAAVPGACCTDEGGCLDVTDSDCTGFGGTYQGVGTSCASTPCFPAVCGPGAGDCGSANGTPGCEDPVCCDAVCDLNPFCCSTAWDLTCVFAAPESCPPPSCDPGPCDTDEAETCGADANGGCNSTPPAFQTVQCGDTICGSIWAQGGSRDTDWFRIDPAGLAAADADADGNVRVTTVPIGEPQTVSFIVNAPLADGGFTTCTGFGAPGDAGCDLDEPGPPADNCSNDVLASGVVNWMTHDVGVFASVGTCDAAIFEGVPCPSDPMDNNYTLQIICEDGPQCGDAMCEFPENCANCEADCGPCPVGCGDEHVSENADEFTITALNSVSCNDGANHHTDNFYAREFTTADGSGLTNPYEACEVLLGIESAVAGDGISQPMEIRLYDVDIAGIDAGTAPIGTVVYDVMDADLEVRVFDLTSIPALQRTSTTGVLTVEIFTPDGQAIGHAFFIGSNAAAQSGPSYLKAPDCGIAAYATTGDIGFPGMHIVLTVNGCTPSCP